MEILNLNTVKLKLCYIRRFLKIIWWLSITLEIETEKSALNPHNKQ